MQTERSRNLLRSGILLVGIALIALAQDVQGAGQAGSDLTSQSVKKSISEHGRARVIVRLRAAQTAPASARLSGSQELQRRLDIATRQQRIRDQLRGTNYSVRREFRSLPYVVIEVDAAGLARLQQATSDVAQIAEDPLFAPTLAESIPQIEADIAHQHGYDGSGSLIAIVDTGIDNSHPFLAGKVIDEACFADREDPEDPGSCPNGGNQQLGAGAGAPCVFASSSCRHGTHVAGIAAGSGDTPGVAPAANLISLQVFHLSHQCGATEELPCARAFGSDITAALERVYEQRSLGNIASVNMSLGGVLSSTTCDTLLPEMTDAINTLKAANIATVVASGNSSAVSAISWPACITAAVAVGAVDDGDNVAWFSNVSANLDLFAPGVNIVSSVPGGGFASFSGTSMATPHVAGAWAVMRQANPSASVDEVLAKLTDTGKPIPDARSGGTITKPRIRLGAALGIEAPLPVLLSLSPSSMGAWSQGGTLTVIGSGFVRASVVNIGGAPHPTTYVSATELRVQVGSSELRTAATSIPVIVVTPPPGGGTSATLPLLLTLPSMSVDRIAANPGSPVTVMVTNGTGTSGDWIALARVGDDNTVYLNWTYASASQTTFTWTVNMPGTAGDYEFRLFTASFMRIATSPKVTVTPAQPPPQPNPPALAVNVTAAQVGQAVSVTLTNGTGSGSAWIALARVGDPDTNYLSWTYVTAGQTSFVWTVNMPGTPGDYEFRLFSGGYTRVATSPKVTVSPAQPPPQPNSPTLAVNVTGVQVGQPVTVTLTNGTGSGGAWIGLARVGDPDTSYGNWTYVTAGQTSFVWTVNMPDTPGDYEFRLFSGGYTRVATSPKVTVAPAPPPPQPNPPLLAVNVTTAQVGQPVTVTLTNGTGSGSSWIGLARVGAPDTSYLTWTYVTAGQTSFVWTINMPGAPGDYEFRFYKGGYTRMATSSTVQVVP
jgi:subtilisin